MRILLITPYYFPYINPRAHRWTAIAEEWVKSGHDVHVICSRRGGLPAEPKHNGVVVYRTGYNSIKEVFYNLFNVKKRRGEAHPIQSDPPRRSRTMTFLVWLNDHIWKKVYFPDDACVWYFPARKKAIRLLRTCPFDAMVTVSLPFTTHMVGLFCKNKFPGLTWLVDVGDPFSLQFEHCLNNHFLYKNWNIRLERRVLESADAVVVTNAGARRLFEENFEKTRRKIRVIPPLRSFSITPSPIPGMDEAKIHIGYFGSFFRHIREPDAFLELLRATFREYPPFREKLVVHFFGDIIEHFLKTFERSHNLKSNLKLHGLLPREEVGKAMAGMDFLLNIGNRTTYQLPSKSVDYLASGKPVLNICSLEADVFKEFFKDYPLILNLILKKSRIEKEQVESFVKFLETKKGERLGGKTIEKLIAPFSPEAISAQYLAGLKGKV